MTLAIFAILFFRLWFLQVLSGNQYAAAASVNYVRNLEVAAPRGEILDSSGQILAKSQRAYAVEISPPSLPVPLTDKNARPPAAAGRRAVRPPCRRRSACRPSARSARWTATGCCTSLRSRARSTRATCSCPTPRPRSATDITSQQLWYLSERQSVVPGRERPADLPAVLSVQGCRVAAARDRQPDHPLGGQATLLRGRVPERLRRPVGPRSLLRPLPARRRRGREGQGRRARQLRRVPVGDVAGRRRQPQAVAERAARGGRPAVAPGVDRLELSAPTGARSWR